MGKLHSQQPGHDGWMVRPPPQPAHHLSPEVNAQLLDMRKQNETLAGQVKAMADSAKASEERAAKAEKDSAIQAALGGFEFANADARTTALSSRRVPIT